MAASCGGRRCWHDIWPWVAGLHHLLPLSILGGNWGAGISLSVSDDTWDYKTVGTGPCCKMMGTFHWASLAGPLSGVLGLPWEFLQPNLIFAALLENPQCLLRCCCSCTCRLVIWLPLQGTLLSRPRLALAWVMANWSAALGIAEAENWLTQQPWGPWPAACLTEGLAVLIWSPTPLSVSKGWSARSCF